MVRERVAFDAMQAPGSKRKAVEAADDEAAAAAEKSDALGGAAGKFRGEGNARSAARGG